jgi:hypothetical protein
MACLTESEMIDKFKETATRGTQALPNTGDKLQAIVDSGASMTCIGNRNEFKTFKASTKTTVMKGIADGLAICGTGTVEYHLEADNGKLICLELQAYYVPGLKGLRLISPQHLKTLEGHRASFVCHSADDSSAGFAELLIRKDEPGWQQALPLLRRVIRYHPRNNLPILTLTLPKTRDQYVSSLMSALCITESANANLSNAQKELLRWHFRLGHVGFHHIQWMIRVGRLQVANPKAVANCSVPKCASCEFGKATKRPTKTNTTVVNKEKEMELKKNDLVPGQRVSVDHYQTAQPGRLYSSRGSTDKSDMFHGGAIFVDHASGYVALRHQVSLSTTDTIKAKVDFERFAYHDGVYIQQYHTDNGVFNAKDFLKELIDSQQQVRFSGVGTGHQNGVAERGIQTVVNMARTMMLHAAMRSPEGFIITELWPMAMDHAAYLYNHIPKMDTGISPVEIWSRTVVSTAHLLNDCHVWGSPVYVLEPKLQKSGVKIPKWNPRSRRGVNMGFSRSHSTLIALILNLMTKSITPQFHVVFDDMFTSVHSNHDMEPATWRQLITSPNCRLKVVLDDEDNPDLSDEWLSTDERLIRDNMRRRNAVQHQRERLHTKHDDPATTLERENVPNATRVPAQVRFQTTNDQSTQEVRFGNTNRVIDDSNTVNRTTQRAQPITIPVRDEEEMQPHQESVNAIPDVLPTVTPSFQRRASTRTRLTPTRFTPGEGAASQWKNNEWKNTNVLNLAEHMSELKWTDNDMKEISALLADHDAEETAMNYQPAAFTAKKRYDPDTPSYMEAMSGDNAEDYWVTMKGEIDSLVKRQTWDIVPRSSCAPNALIVPGTWAFRCKRRPDGTFRKFKSRWCVRGDIERRINGKNGEVMDTYSPVVQWSSVRLMLVLTIILGMVTQAVDFSNAFAQADMPEGLDVFLEMPENFKSSDSSDSVLKLKKSLYGQTIAPKLWYEKLKKGLENRGFVASKVDPCMFISRKVVICSYVDDLTIYAMTQRPIDDLLESFRNDGDQYNWEMTVEGSVHEFLGINIERNGNKWKMTQTGLINNVLKATNMTNCNAKDSPTESDGQPLGSHKNSRPAKEDWSYSSVVGMLLYLASNSRPDISFAVHQCARFTHNPREIHEKALLRICRYLKGTLHDGLIYEPSEEINVDCYCDADFAALHGIEASDDPNSAKSRTGYVITIANCPVLWVSKLQTEIALSTLESEFIALSSSFRSLIPVKRLIEETLSGLDIKTQVRYSSKSTVFEDNAGALQLATTKRLTPRTRHIATKYFWFLKHVDEGLATIVKVESSQNKSDTFTKSLKPQEFIRARKLLCGW